MVAEIAENENRNDDARRHDLSPWPRYPDPMNINDLLRAGTHFAETRGEHIHIINSSTGVTEIVLTKDRKHVHSNSSLVEHKLQDGSSVWAPTGVNPVVGGERAVMFSPLVVDLICAKLVEGGALSRICQEGGMPTYATLCAWRRAHKWIDERLEQARRDRAEYLRDQALEEAMGADEDNALAQKLKHDALKWAAGVDHEKYNPKTKIDAVVSAPTQIIVHTGISREVHDARETPKEILPQSSQGSERLLEMDGPQRREVRQDDVQVQTLPGTQAELVSGEGAASSGDASS